MNKTKIIKYLTVPLIIAGTACNKLEDFGDTNVNPGDINTPSVAALLTNVEAGVPSYAAQTRPGYYAQYFSETQYTDASLYSIPQLEFSGNYSGALYDLENIIQANPGNNQTAVARILKAYIFLNMTDRWGDVPYSQALKGSEELTPAYDKQEDIYKGLFTELKEAVAQFDGTSQISGDVSNYAGSVVGWKKLANSIRVMMAIQLSKKYPAAGGLAATELTAAINDPAGVISENSENYTITFTTGAFKSPWYNLYDGRKDVGESKTMTDLTSSLDDKRQLSFGSSDVGVPYGWSRDKVVPWTDANPTWAYVLDPSLRAPNSPVVVISAAEVTLARAEAADRGWTTESVSELYEKGIELSFEQWDVDGELTDAYFAQPAVALPAATGTGANLKPIAIQRYLASYPDGLQGWNIVRATGFPVLTPAQDAVNASKLIPHRYTYGTLEYGSNKESADAAAALIPGGDNQDSKVWWDQ